MLMVQLRALVKVMYRLQMGQANHKDDDVTEERKEGMTKEGEVTPTKDG